MEIIRAGGEPAERRAVLKRYGSAIGVRAEKLEEGRSAIRLAIRCLQGEKLDKRYLIPCPAITKENADQFKGQF